jgi:hypothetical protein
MFDLKFARLVAEGELELLCPEMKLLVCPGYHEVAYSGSGIIRSNKEGRLYFKTVGGIPGVVRQRSGVVPGTIPRDADHLMLRATDDRGRTWNSNWLFAEPPLFSSVFERSLRTLTYADDDHHQSNSTVSILIPNAPELPFDMATNHETKIGEEVIRKGFTIDHHVHLFDQARATFWKRENRWLEIEGSGIQEALSTWPGLLCQSLEFLTAASIRPAVLVPPRRKS